MKPAASTTTAAPQNAAAHEAGQRKSQRARPNSFATHLATQQGLSERAAEAGARTGSRASSHPDSVGMPAGEALTDGRGSRSRRLVDADEPPPPADGSPFRPLPSCVFAPGVGRTPPPMPPATPPDVARMATELLRSLQVGGERGRGRVRMVLASGRDGEPLEITVEESPMGITARLPTGHDATSQRLVLAIGQELRRRGIELRDD